jgi:hypothetical protein
MAKTWTAVEYDLSKRLTAAAPNKRLTIPPNMKLQLVITLEDAAYARLSKDPTWVQKMQEKANAKAVPVLDRLTAQVKEMDTKAAKFDAKTAQIFTNDINKLISTVMEQAGREMAKEIDTFFDQYKKDKKELTSFRIKSAGKISINAVGIVASAAVAGATHAVLAPPAIVAIVRASVVIGQECVKLALDADQFAKLINAELKVLAKFMEDSKKKAEEKLSLIQKAMAENKPIDEKEIKKQAQLVALKEGKIKPGKEFALSAISGLLGVETPSITNLESHIGVHEVDITKLEKKSHELGPKVYEAMDKEEKWRTKLNAEKNLPSEKVTKLKDKLGKAEKVLQKMVEATTKINESVTKAKLRHKRYKDILEAMKNGVPEWLQWVTPVTSMAVDIGLTVAGGGSALELALGVVQTAESDIAQVLIDKI